jgi:hypothetical protein
MFSYQFPLKYRQINHYLETSDPFSEAQNFSLVLHRLSFLPQITNYITFPYYPKTKGSAYRQELVLGKVMCYALERNVVQKAKNRH